MKRIITIVLLAAFPAIAPAATLYFRGTETIKVPNKKPFTDPVFVVLTTSDKKDSITQTILRRHPTKKTAMVRDIAEFRKALDGTWSAPLPSGAKAPPAVVSMAAGNVVSMNRVINFAGKKANVTTTFPHPRVIQVEATLTDEKGAQIRTTSIDAGEVLETQYKTSILLFDIEDPKPAAAAPGSPAAAPQKK
ncbi:MAG: hypothetical protein V4760_08195 [Bdellovibrionota bacterium]